MMIGVAQVIGMKPTFRSFFSGAPPAAKASAAVRIGNTSASAAAAVVAPTALRNARRCTALGNIARIRPASTTRRTRAIFPGLVEERGLGRCARRRRIVLGLGRVLPAAAATPLRGFPIGVEGIVER